MHKSHRIRVVTSDGVTAVFDIYEIMALGGTDESVKIFLKYHPDGMRLEGVSVDHLLGLIDKCFDEGDRSYEENKVEI